MNPGAAGADGAPQTRDDRIALLASALERGKDLGGGRVRIEFLGVNPPPCGVEEATITIEDLPGPFVEATIAVDLGSVKTGSWWNDADGAPGQTSYNDRRRNKALRAAGWRVEGKARLTLEADPGDPVSVGAVVDAIQGTFEAAASVKGAPPVPPATWRVGYLPPGDSPATRGTEDVAPDEPWLDAMTETDLRTRLVKLAGSRGGTVVVRATDVAGVELDLRARRRGDRIEVTGHDPATSWKGRWTMPATAPDAGAIVRDLEAALAPPGGGPAAPSLSVRLEQHDEAAEWTTETVTSLLVFAALAGIAVVALAAFVARPTGTEASVGLLDRGTDGDLGAILLLGLIAITALVVALGAGFVTYALTDRPGLGYATGAWLSAAAAALAGAACVIVVIAVGTWWGTVVGAFWAVVIGVWAVRSLMGRGSL